MAAAKQNRTSVNKRFKKVFCVLCASCKPCFILSYLVLFLIQKKEPATVPKITITGSLLKGVKYKNGIKVNP